MQQKTDNETLRCHIKCAMFGETIAELKVRAAYLHETNNIMLRSTVVNMFTASIDNVNMLPSDSKVYIYVNMDGWMDG